MNIIYRKAVLQDVDQPEQLIGISARSINIRITKDKEINDYCFGKCLDSGSAINIG